MGRAAPAGVGGVIRAIEGPRTLLLLITVLQQPLEHPKDLPGATRSRS